MTLREVSAEWHCMTVRLGQGHSMLRGFFAPCTGVAAGSPGAAFLCWRALSFFSRSASNQLRFFMPAPAFLPPVACDTLPFRTCLPSSGTEHLESPVPVP